MIENRISDRAKILLIDEDTSISYLIRRAMEKENYKIYIAGRWKTGNGDEYRCLSGSDSDG